ncbi:M15 family metallopeptidase [Denitromonas iodatirespirans]|uniref:M15 family metallopeptidase n=1 Tax=Denitromonas iodatirespirans TaxID=2795389 RepID=A0A944D807_DENI1|nr:M15 family metallopeptidase [Denitromonas iodatirespirans]MBT0960211.1 M15 family metallopeptidase [Denitromonas iodatirespirans]
MIVLALLSYFLIVCAAALLLVFPGHRAMLASGCRASFDRLRQRGDRVWRTGGRVFGGLRARLLTRLGAIGRFVATQRLACLCGGLVVALPPLLAFALQGPAVFDFSDEVQAPGRQISALLQGEQLVPPLPLPPEFFSTREVEQVRPDVFDASRNWEQLDPEFTQRLLHVMKTLRERYGYELTLIEGYRSPERQMRLAALGPQVTLAGAYMSYHQYGLAADCAFIRDGKLVISERDPWVMQAYEHYGEVAESVGLTWGGRWKMRDFGHVELRRKDVLGRETS